MGLLQLCHRLQLWLEFQSSALEHQYAAGADNINKYIHTHQKQLQYLLARYPSPSLDKILWVFLFVLMFFSAKPTCGSSQARKHAGHSSHNTGSQTAEPPRNSKTYIYIYFFSFLFWKGAEGNFRGFLTLQAKESK